MDRVIIFLAPEDARSEDGIMHDLVCDDYYYEEFMEFLEDPNDREDLGLTFLHVACMSQADNSKTIQLLFERGADVDSFTMYKHTPLHFAVAYRKSDGVAALIEAGASVNFRDFLGRTPLHFSIGAKWSYPPIPVLDAPCDMWIVERLLSHPEININPLDHAGNTPLMWAVKRQHADAVKALLRKGANPNIPNMNNRTPLHKALSSRNPNPHIVIALLTNGAGIYCEDKFGQTPIDILIRKIRVHDKPVIDKQCVWLFPLKYQIKETIQHKLERIFSVSPLLLAIQAMLIIALRYNIRNSLKRKLFKIPELYQYLNVCCQEVNLMRRQIIYDKFTLHDFARDCVQSRFADPVPDIYLPVLKILVTSCFTYHYFLQLKIPSEDLLCSWIHLR